MSEIKDIIKFNNDTKYSFYLISIVIGLSCIIILPIFGNIFKSITKFVIIVILSIIFYNLFSNTYKLYTKYPNMYISNDSIKILSNFMMSSLVIIVLGILLCYMMYIFIF